jgi:lysophospholipase L1-like esterase
MTSIKIVCMGDSITAGQYIEPPKKWTAHLKRRLDERFGRGSCTVVSNGVSGETTRQGLERFAAAVQTEHPDIVVIQFGLNDCNCWQTDGGLPRVSLRAFEANLTEMVERSRRFGAREVILSTNHRTLRRGPMVSGEVYEEANARYSQVVREVSAATGSKLCDVHHAFVPLTDRELSTLLLPAPDILHLSESGNSLYADTIYPLVESTLLALEPELV